MRLILQKLLFLLKLNQLDRLYNRTLSDAKARGTPLTYSKQKQRAKISGKIFTFFNSSQHNISPTLTYAVKIPLKFEFSFPKPTVRQETRR